MADPYVIFPGTPGVNVQTDDVNLLGADTAHIYQSIGLWDASTRSQNMLRVVDSTSPYADSALEWEASTTANNTQIRIGGAVGSGAVSVVDGLLDFGCWIKPSVDNARLTARDQSGGGLGNYDFSVLPGEWQLIQAQYTVSGETGFFFEVKVGTDDPSGITSGDKQWIAAAYINQSGVTSFTPSLRVVGSLYEETVPVDMPVVFAADGSPLTVGEGWAGNGYSYTRYDGADASAPLVASFQAGDVPVAVQLPG